MTISLPELCTLLLEDAPATGPVLFRVDAGRLPGLSFGHMSRCLLLSRTLRSQGLPTALLMRELTDGVAFARSQGERVLTPTPETLRHHPARALIVDLPYEPEPELLEEARLQGLHVVYLDDTGRACIHADVVLNTSILARPGMYPYVRRNLLGLEYFFLDAEDLSLTHRGRTNRKASRPIHAVMTFGGSDPTGLTDKALTTMAALVTGAGLAQQAPALRLDVVCGPGFAGFDKVQALAAQISARVLVAPPRLLPLLAEADLVICSGGRTLYECHALGIPVLAVASTPAEAAAVGAFVERGLIRAGLPAWDTQAFTQELSRILKPSTATSTVSGITRINSAP